MASNIITKNQPAAFMPGYNRVEWCVFESDPGTLAQPGYKYVFTLTITGHGSKTYYVSPEPKQNFGIKDFSKYLRQFLIEMIPEPTDNEFINSFYQAPEECILEYELSVVPGWNVSGQFEVNPNEVDPVEVTGLYVWCGSFNEHPWIDQINQGTPFDTWVMNVTNGSDGKFLTSYPNKDLEIDDLAWLYFMTDTPSSIDRMVLKTYDVSDSLLNTIEVSNVIPFAQPKEFLLRLAAGPANLNMIPAGQIISGTQPFIDSSVSYYTIQLEDNSNNVSSELVTITIKQPCRYQTYRIHFLNRLGGFDAYNFTFRSQPTRETKRKSYTKTDYNVDVNGLRYDHKDDGTVDYYVTTRDKIKLRSDYLTQAEHTWLNELVDSPTAFLEFTKLDGTRDFKPIQSKTGKWTEKITDIDKLFQLIIDIDLSLENIRQDK